MLASRSDLSYWSGRSSTPFTTVKIVVVAPIPSASAATAATVKPGLRRSARQACRRSCPRVLIVRSGGASWLDGRRRSFGAQRERRIHAGCPSRGQITGEQCDRRQQE